MGRVCLIIPVRLESERFPNKPLELFQGKTLIQNSIDIAKKLDFVDEIVLACSEPNLDLIEICSENRIVCRIIEQPVSCGTEKVIYVKELASEDYSLFVTLPVDEPSIDPEELNRIFREIQHAAYEKITTLYTDFFCLGDLLDSRSCKVIEDRGEVRYMSRAVIPATKSGGTAPLCNYKKHVGVFFFPRYLISKYLWSSTVESNIESLEQNMFLRKGLYCRKIKHIGFGIDTKDQIESLEKRMTTN